MMKTTARILFDGIGYLKAFVGERADFAKQACRFCQIGMPFLPNRCAVFAKQVCRFCQTGVPFLPNRCATATITIYTYTLLIN